MNTQIKVSVIMLTYNHENFIADAIAGVLKQQTDFKYELIIADDCSPDNTRDVVDTKIISDSIGVIQYYRHSENKGLNKNFEFALGKVRGEYIAICEGDDYWTDPLKLQIQTDYLDKNDEVSLVCTERSILYQETNKTIKSKLKLDNHIEVYGFVQGLTEMSIHTLTVLIRTKYILEYQDLRKSGEMLNYLDFSMWIYAANFGDIAKVYRDTSTYRSLQHSATHSPDICKKWKLKKMYLGDFLILKKVVNEKYSKFMSHQEYLRIKSFYLFSAHCKDYEYYDEFKDVFRSNKDYLRLYTYQFIKRMPWLTNCLFFIQRIRVSLKSKF
jgi:glycosyltransferase involved in cell wall biosynthesis